VKKEQLINLTPHKITLLDNDHQRMFTLQPTQTVRVNEEVSLAGTITYENNSVPILATKYGLIDLPDIDQNCIYIVSRIVKNAIAEHYPFLNKLFVVPGGIVRSKEGEIVGCTNLSY